MSQSAQPEPPPPGPVNGPGIGPGFSAGTPEAMIRPLPVRKFADLLPATTPRYPASTSNGSAADPRVPPARHDAAEASRREEVAHVQTIVRMVALAAFESMTGVRPVHQLARWLEAGQYEKLRCRVALINATRPDDGTRSRRNTSIRRTRLCPVATGAYEASLVVAENDRVRAAALRVERRHGHWTVVDLQLG
ncbi:MAG: Rv3235 family protein [Arthrobacter sp.]|uniref:Rv3235 family protein n=1 Tax=unclassified Arthrobacter TaxID=235627 RepID=UPI00264AEF20|nr:Rv3235 family protein [Micrococcaceae bacterium]MDN5825208.1 Rv3235 family protein [Micrococcaceae bacterium]MDN5879393.1 Rv3235 family protein [Micrococcaceae bacterium]MDN5885566.1 Rv3235 family protein [Micrococcaceae bacterium]MDN6169481.1 Rv3235 family protein [Micrococcaceae bacterium]